MVYIPQNMPRVGDVAQLAEAINREFTAVARALANPDLVHLDTLHVEPKRPRSGMVVFADGTDWDPGSGQGFYGYNGTAWVLLG